MVLSRYILDLAMIATISQRHFVSRCPPQALVTSGDAREIKKALSTADTCASLRSSHINGDTVPRFLHTRANGTGCKLCYAAFTYGDLIVDEAAELEVDT